MNSPSSSNPSSGAADGRPTGVDPLLRWHHPSEGTISPDRFIPSPRKRASSSPSANGCSERLSRDAPLDRFRFAAPAHRSERLGPSAAQAGFLRNGRRALAESGLPAELLELEITESAVMESPRRPSEFWTCSAAWASRWPSTISAPATLPSPTSSSFHIDHLKIDRSFVRDIEHDLNDRAIAMAPLPWPTPSD